MHIALISVIQYSSQYLDFTSKYVRTYSKTPLEMDGTLNWPNPYRVDWRKLISSKVPNLKNLDVKVENMVHFDICFAIREGFLHENIGLGN